MFFFELSTKTWQLRAIRFFGRRRLGSKPGVNICGLTREIGRVLSWSRRSRASFAGCLLIFPISPGAPQSFGPHWREQLTIKSSGGDEMRSSTAIVQQALAYADMGLSVIPVREKEAAVGWKDYQARRMGAAEIRRHFRNPTITGIAAIMGSVSGDIACRDFDKEQSYCNWKAEFPSLAKELPTVRTPGHPGFHVYFRSPGCKFEELGDGELRAGGKVYCLLPQSTFEGRSY